MSTEHIPAKDLIICDGCGERAEGKSFRGIYHGGYLTIGRDAYDFQGNAVASNNINLDLCSKCMKLAVEALNTAFRKRPNHTVVR